MEDNKEESKGIMKIMGKSSKNTPLMSELENDVSSEMKDQFVGFITSEKTEKMFNTFVADLYGKYGSTHMIVIKGNKNIQQYVISLIELKDIESFKLKPDAKPKSYSAMELATLAKDFVK
jgi:hypothetical protein